LQLNRLVQFHKVMSDPTRIRILVLLSKGSKHGQTLAGILGLTPPAVSHHMSKLRELNLVGEHRDKNTVYFHVNKSILEHYASGLIDILQQEEDVMKYNAEHQKIVDNFSLKDGRLKTIPAQRKKKLILLHHIAKGLKRGKVYEEKEINEYIKQYHDDYATIRREFIINQIMYREKGRYELNPEELWQKP
jgi:DNA-binding transcriptional ArsR family regulator